jgi:CRP/FNR family transcriptional regulator
VGEEPAVGRCLLSVAARHLVAAHQQMLLLGRKTAEERIASFLLAMAERSGGERFVLPMTRADIADYLGLTIETVSRIFTQLRTDGLIALRGTSEVVIADREALEDIADGT